MSELVPRPAIVPSSHTGAPEAVTGQTSQAIDTALAKLIDRNDVEAFERGFAAQGIATAEQHIFRAASLGRTRLLEYLLRTVPTEPGTRTAAFRVAIRAGELEATSFLHQTGIDLNISAAEFLDAAISNGSAEVTRYLHENGISLGVASAEAMAQVARRGHVSVLKYLHTNGMRLAEIGPVMLRHAVRNGQVGLIKYLAHQAGIALQHIDLQDLIAAMEQGHLQTLRYLGQRGVSLEQARAVALDAAGPTVSPEIVEFFRGSNDLVYPPVITIDNHRSCNASCRMCPTQPYDPGSGAMTEVVFGALVNQLNDFKDAIQFVIFGVHGEPLLDKQLEKRVSDVRALGVEDIRINTNGSALTAERARKLVQAGTRSIAISVDGVTPETYEAVRVGLKYRTVINNIDNLLRVRDELGAAMNVTLRMIIQIKNAHEVGAWDAYWKERLNPQLDALDFQPVHNWAYRTRERKDFGTTPCSSVTDTVVVSHDGNIPLCCLDHEPRYEFGNILSQHLLDIYNNAQWKKVRALHSAAQRNTLNLCGSCARPEERLNTEASADTYRDMETAFSWGRD